MREQLEARLNELKREFEVGRTELQQLQSRETFLRETMLRIGGAIQVLEEMLAGQGTGSHEEGNGSADAMNDRQLLNTTQDSHTTG